MNKIDCCSYIFKQSSKLISILMCFLIFKNQILAQNSKLEKNIKKHIINPGSKTSTIGDWEDWKTRSTNITEDEFSEKYGSKIGSARGFCIQEIKVKSSSLYRNTAYVRTTSDAEEIQLIVSDFGSPVNLVSSVKTELTKVSVDVQPLTHKGERNKLLGISPRKEIIETCSAEKQFNEQTPATFLLYAIVDNRNPLLNSIPYFTALKKLLVLSEIHLYQNGGHGFGLENAGSSLLGTQLCAAWLPINHFII